MAFAATSNPFGAATGFSFPSPAVSAPASSGFNFGFGASTAQSPAPAFGTFGATSPPAFGAATSAPASTFGAAFAPPTPALSTPAFGSVFGATSTPAFPASTFNFAASSAPTTSAFSFAAPAASTPSLFSTTPTLGTMGTPGAAPGATPITNKTKWDELTPQQQQQLSDIQKTITTFREDCAKLDKDTRLHDSTSLKQTVEDDTASLKRSLQSLLSSINTDHQLLADFRDKVSVLMQHTETAIRTYQRAKLWRDAPQQFKSQPVPPAVQEMLSSPVVLPSPYLLQAVQGFQDTLVQYRSCMVRLEALLPSQRSLSNPSNADEADLTRSLPVIVSNMHDFFVHVAAKLERIHNEIQAAKASVLAQRRAKGDFTDPFEKAARRQQALNKNTSSSNTTPSSASVFSSSSSITPTVPLLHAPATPASGPGAIMGFGTMPPSLPSTPLGTGSVFGGSAQAAPAASGDLGRRQRKERR